MVPKDLDKLIEKYLEGNCTEAERTVVKSFYASLGGAAPGQASGMSSHDDQLRADRMLTKIVARTQDVENDDHRSHSWRYAGVAAALAQQPRTVGGRIVMMKASWMAPRRRVISA